jgi:predicted GNAT family acetyltransferase
MCGAAIIVPTPSATYPIMRMAAGRAGCHTPGDANALADRRRNVNMDIEQLPIVDNRERRRFEVGAGDQAAFLRYTITGDRIDLIHTEVPEELEGHGLGGKLAAFGLNYAREHGLRVVPTCPFVAAYIERHPEYADLVVAGAAR